MSNKSPKILVVDDLPDWRTTIQGLLNDEGYQQIKVAESRTAALKLFESETFDLAVLDMRLDETDEGNTDGLTLAQEIRQTWPQTKVIILTGYGTPETQELALQPDRKGRQLTEDFIPKTKSVELIAAVQRVLKQLPKSNN
ncbi:MAG: response regulator [Anaerolineales bacterium]|nr:response regulator [Anaerolineales bacterium]